MPVDIAIERSASFPHAMVQIPNPDKITSNLFLLFNDTFTLAVPLFCT